MPQLLPADDRYFSAGSKKIDMIQSYFTYRNKLDLMVNLVFIFIIRSYLCLKNLKNFWGFLGSMHPVTD